jgi:hypothetical protein
MTTSTQSINGSGQNFRKRTPCQYSPMEKLFLGPRKLIFPFPGNTCVNITLQDREKSKSSPQISFKASLQTSSGSFLSQTKHPTYQTVKPSLMRSAQQMSKRWMASNRP